MKNRLSNFISDREWNFAHLKNIIENARPVSQENDPVEGTYDIKGSVAIVTGASSGIGRAIAGELAGKKANVILASRNREKLEELADEIKNCGGTAIAIPTDVTNQSQCQALIEDTLKTFGKIDILVNNAGISMRATLQDVELDVLKKVMDTNFWGTVYCTKYALPYILKQKGSIVGISSISGITPLPGRTGYAASKHAMDGFLGSLRVENTQSGLHVMVVHPGFTTSNIRNMALNENGEPQIETPLEEDKLMPAERVAREVIDGIMERKKEITLSTEGKLITWMYRRMPGMAEWLIFREMKQETGSPF